MTQCEAGLAAIKVNIYFLLLHEILFLKQNEDSTHMRTAQTKEW